MNSHILYFSIPKTASTVYSVFAIFLHFPLNETDFDFIYGWVYILAEN